MAEADPAATFNVHDAKTQLSKLIDRAHAGEEIVLAKAGVPYAKLVPYAPPAKPRRQPGRYAHLRGLISEEELMAPCYTAEEIEAFETGDIFPSQD